MDEWGRSGLANVEEDLGDGLGVRKERDKGEGFLAGRADQRKHFIDPGQESGPPGGSGGGGIGSVLGEVKVPERFARLEIGDNWLLGLELDETDVESVVLYALNKPAAAG